MNDQDASFTTAADTIERLSQAVYPSYAMLAGMQLDLFTPLKDGPLGCAGIARAIGVNADKLQPLLYALVATGLLLEENERFVRQGVSRLHECVFRLVHQ